MKNIDSQCPEASVLLLRRIERFLRRSGMSPSRFGGDAAGDSRLVFDLRRGRRLRLPTRQRIEDWLARQEGERKR